MTSVTGFAALPETRKTQLDGLRFFAFLLVFIEHVHIIRIENLGAIGVSLFFALSGFLITRVLMLGETGSLIADLKTFYIRRTLRIVPIYYALLTFMLVIGMLPEPGWYYSFLANFQMAHEGWTVLTTTIFWTLCVEEQFYLLFPVLFLATPSKLRGTLIAALILLCIAVRFCAGDTFLQARGFMLLPWSGQYLLWGALAAVIDIKLPRRTWLGELCFLLGAVFVIIHGLRLDPQIQDQWWKIAVSLHVQNFYETTLYSLTAVGCALIVFGLWRMENRGVLALFRFRPFVYLGIISYGMYLVHTLCIELGTALFDAHWLIRTFSFALTIGVASLSWFFFEGPINKLKQRFPYRAAATG